ncbi:Swt1 family HEPN domain-containing protein [Actinoallomurus sp. NPDC052308]|uniref:Swt1 family HEPN domain-containing protein n=1 Tax=Actinoallomurus sp. NPDC052308 TaxID=3155530 RepID=UPI00341709A9
MSAVDGPDRLTGLEAEDHARFGHPRRLTMTDPALQLRVLVFRWQVFDGVLPRSARSYAGELRETRNRPRQARGTGTPGSCCSCPNPVDDRPARRGGCAYTPGVRDGGRRFREAGARERDEGRQESVPKDRGALIMTNFSDVRFPWNVPIDSWKRHEQV